MLPFCEHPHSEVRYRYIAGGARVLQRQCIDCGYSVGSFISQKDKSVEYLANLSAWDAALQEATIKGNQTKADANSALRSAERQKQSEEWWTWYNAYLQTPVWRAKRRMALARDRYMCVGCLTEKAEEVHHLTYAHVGNELLYELASLCKACHAIAHEPNEHRGPPIDL